MIYFDFSSFLILSSFPSFRSEESSFFFGINVCFAFLNCFLTLSFTLFFLGIVVADASDDLIDEMLESLFLCAGTEENIK